MAASKGYDNNDRTWVGSVTTGPRYKESQEKFSACESFAELLYEEAFRLAGAVLKPEDFRDRLSNTNKERCAPHLAHVIFTRYDAIIEKSPAKESSHDNNKSLSECLPTDELAQVAKDFFTLGNLRLGKHEIVVKEKRVSDLNFAVQTKLLEMYPFEQAKVR